MDDHKPHKKHHKKKHIKKHPRISDRDGATRDRGRNDRSNEENDPKKNNRYENQKQLAPSSGSNKQQVMTMIPATTYDIEEQAIPLPVKSPPPPRAPPGGSWGYVIHLGEKTCLWSAICCFLCGLIPVLVLFCLPFDKKRAYRSRQGEIYDEHGHLLGNTVKFQEEDPFLPGADSDQMVKSIGIAICLAAVVVIALVIYIITYINNATSYSDDYNNYRYDYGY